MTHTHTTDNELEKDIEDGIPGNFLIIKSLNK